MSSSLDRIAEQDYISKKKKKNRPAVRMKIDKFRWTLEVSDAKETEKLKRQPRTIKALK